MKSLLWVLPVMAALMWSQDVARPLPNAQAYELATKSLQLMEAIGVGAPETSKPGAALAAAARQALMTVRLSPGGNSGPATYELLNDFKAYLALLDALGRSSSYPEQTRRQQLEMREQVARLDMHFQALMTSKDRQLRSPDRDNVQRYFNANVTAGAPVAGRPRVVFLGDSITDFWRLNEYFPDRDFINRGISGQITGEMLGRMETDVVSLKPAAMVVLAGTNDIGREVALTTIEANLTMIADLADYHRIKPIFASLLPVSDYHERENPTYQRTKQRPPTQIRALNSWLQDFCARRNFAYVDYFSETSDASGLLKPDLSDDGLHPNSAGYRIMAPLVLAAIDKTVRPPRPAIVQPPEPRRRLFSK